MAYYTRPDDAGNQTRQWFDSPPDSGLGWTAEAAASQASQVAPGISYDPGVTGGTETYTNASGQPFVYAGGIASNTLGRGAVYKDPATGKFWMNGKPIDITPQDLAAQTAGLTEAQRQNRAKL